MVVVVVVVMVINVVMGFATIKLLFVMFILEIFYTELIGSER